MVSLFRFIHSSEHEVISYCGFFFSIYIYLAVPGLSFGI